MVTLREARPDDAPAIAEVHVRAWQVGYRGLLPQAELDGIDRDERRAAWRQHLADPGDRSIVVAEKDDGGVVGFASCGSARDGADGELFTCYVDPQHWGTGVGQALLRSARRLLRARGYDEAVLWTLQGNDRALRFYRADGWEIDGSIKDEVMWGSSTTSIRLRRRLEDEGHVAVNRRAWDGFAPDYATAGARQWSAEPSWGELGVPESALGLLGGDLAGMDVVELGCGTGYVSAWCRRRGARLVVGIDNSPAQLATAAALQRRHDEPFPLLLADAEHAPFAEGSFDLAVSEYGAAIWCDPRQWIPEAARLLRSGGRLVFLGNSVLSMLCAPDFEAERIGPVLRRPQRDIHRFEWPDTPGVEFHVSHGEMIRILRRAGFEILDLVESYCEPDAVLEHSPVTAEWASRWPGEEIWVARRR
jgi:SAM-dependent methyltransferase/ribosomal protein S18 acetylase RimI-like enzyme